MKCLDEIGRRARLEPEVFQLLGVHCPQDAERIVDTFGVAGEMIAVVEVLEFGQGFLIGDLVIFCNALYAVLEIPLYLLLCESDNGRILRRHGDVAQVVELRKDAQL